MLQGWGPPTVNILHEWEVDLCCCKPLRFGGHLLQQHNLAHLTDTRKSNLSQSLLAHPVAGDSCCCGQIVVLEGSPGWWRSSRNCRVNGEVVTRNALLTEKLLDLESCLSKGVLTHAGHFGLPGRCTEKAANQGTIPAGLCPGHRNHWHVWAVKCCHDVTITSGTGTLRESTYWKQQEAEALITVRAGQTG